MAMLKYPQGKSRASIYIDFSTEAVARVVPFLPLYFDEILITDPAHHPWSLKPEMNPIASPNRFVSDTYEYLISVISVMPQILMKRLNFVPDPFNFSQAVRKNLISRAQKRQKAVPLSARDREASERKVRRMTADCLARLPDGRFLEQIKSYDPLLSDKQAVDCMNFFREERRKDPRYLPNVELSKDGSVLFWRTGGNLEQMMMVIGLTNSIPIFESDMRLAEVSEISDAQSEFHDKLIFEIPLFISNDHFLLEIIRDLEPFIKNERLDERFVRVEGKTRWQN